MHWKAPLSGPTSPGYPMPLKSSHPPHPPCILDDQDEISFSPIIPEDEHAEGLIKHSIVALP